MYTVIETPSFASDAKKLWNEEDHGAFCAWLAANPEAGKVIPSSGGCRKVRWSRPGMGKEVVLELSTSHDSLVVSYGFSLSMPKAYVGTYPLTC